MNKQGIIKKAITAVMISFVTVCCHGQQLISLTPYKDGRTFPDSLKDYATPVKMSLSSGVAKKSVPVNQKDNFTDQSSGNTTEERVKPVAVSAAKKP